MKKNLLALLALLLVGAGCGSPVTKQPADMATTATDAPAATTNQTSVRDISLESGYFFFKPNKLVLKKDQPVRITFKNQGVHTFTVDELGLNFPLRDSSVTIEFTPSKTGTFEFYCAIPGHRQSGQVGTMVVE